MLIKFSVANYLSFKDLHSIDLTADSIREFPDHVLSPVQFNPNERILKSLVIYGYNSHGKSNLLKALAFFTDLTSSSFSTRKQIDAYTINNYQLNITTQTQPSFFEITFLARNIKYRYGCKISNERVFEEWLFYSEPRLRENNLFMRLGQEIRINKVWNKENNNHPEKAQYFTKQHHLFLSVLLSSDQQPRHIPAIADWLANVIPISDLTEAVHQKRAAHILSRPFYRTLFEKLIEDADLGFKTIIDRMDNVAQKKSLEKEFIKIMFATELERFELYSKHEVYNDKHKVVSSAYFEILKSESVGNVKFIMLCCYLAYAIKESALLLIDELDASLHPDLLRLIVQQYNNGKINATGSQMIFTTHSTSLLDKVLRRDQVVFVEKNQYGESSIRRMHSADAPVRLDTSIEREYRKGKLGGVSQKLIDRNSQLNLEF